MRRWLLCASLVGCRWAFDPLATTDGGMVDAAGDAGDARSLDGTTADALDSSLVAWFTFDDDIDDMQAADVTGRGHHATCAGPCPTVTMGHVGNAVTGFQPTAPGGLEVLDHPELRVTTMTLAVWMRWQSGGGFASAIAKPFGGATSNSFQIDVDDTGIPRFSTHDGTSTTRISGATLTDDVWVHLAGTYDGATMRLYVNATEVAQSAAPAAAYDPQSVFLGADRNAGATAESFDGALDDLRIYNVALAQPAIALLAQ